jgi:amino acid transporter
MAMSLVTAFSSAGSLGVWMLVVPRMLFVLGSQGGLPRIFAAVDGVGRTPAVAIVCTAVLVWILTITGTFAYLATFAAIGNGAHEANPLMQPFAKNQAAMLALKAGVAVSTIWMSERMWKHGNRVGAIISMVASNAVTAVVVAHNYRLNSQLAR